ncbi:MAG: hypothetical protein K0B37_06980 [Bacteroidales bacterium]|nr:hypothetical protein [Bacteroidales bacterium]
MLRKTSLFAALIIFMGLNLSFGQRVERFSDNDDEFILQINQLIQELDRQERNQAILIVDTFARVFAGDYLDTDQKERIVNTMNRMLGMRLRTWPDYLTYLNGVVKVFNTPRSKQNFHAWHDSFQPLMNQANQQRLINYWQRTLDLFEKNIIFSSASISWQLRDNDYSLSFIDGKTWLNFQNNDLVCYAQGDSSLIYSTTGKVDLNEGQLEGRGGKITWERVQLHPDEVFANLTDYTLDLAVARYEAESVTFYNRNFFSEPLYGKLSERLLANVKPENANYPRFESYQALHEIKDLFPGIDFRGGFTMMGQRVLGSGTDKVNATIKFYRSDSLYITARSRAFSIREDRIITERAEVSIYLSGDSIHHPSVNMRYLHPTREFSIQRDERGYSRAPFANSYHKVDMYCEAIYWNVDTHDMELQMIRGLSDKGNAVIESHDFFSELRYMRMQGISGLHPLIRLRNFAREYNSRTFPVNEYARYLRQDVGSVVAQLLSFSFYGFLSYDADNETVTLYDRLYHYITAYAGRSDYDVMQIQSEAPVNGRLNMNNFDLHLFGVDQIPLSREKNVIIHPYEQEVILQKNRDMYFHGKIESGLFDFYGQEFYFNYDMFKIDLVNTDSMSFRVRSHTPDTRGRYTYHRVQTVLEGINGELLVDHPRNKSGQLPYPRYPIFNSNNESYMFYDRESVHDGAYNREQVYLKLIPFTIDSLDNATTDNIQFDGVFISTGVFPDFYDYITVQEDYSLGFNTKTPEEGYPVWDGKAVYKGPIRMSNRGLRADGRLEFLNATVDARDMFMYPDSARGHMNAVNIAANTGMAEHPKVTGMDVRMTFTPYDEVMKLRNTTRPFELFDGQVNMDGALALSHSGMDGSGKLRFFGSELVSDDIDFNNSDFTADNSDIDVMAADGRNLALRATKYNAAVDIGNKKSRFENIQNASKLAFQLSRFDGWGFDWTWDMASGSLNMRNSIHETIAALDVKTPVQWINYDFSGHELISALPAQDSLRFFAGVLQYDLAENVIHADHVKIIKVADAAVFPHDEKVRILQRAEIGKLENALILANTASLKHRFYDADVNIVSRWNYTGSGMYDYADMTGKKQTVFFENIRVDRQTRTTLANADITPEMDFTISPQFGFNGTIGLRAERSDFTFEGATRIFADCPGYQPNSIRFKGQLKADSIYIPLAEDLRNEANGRIITSLMLAGDSVHIYPGLFTRQRHYSDLEIISAGGYLTYDHSLGEYQVSSVEKLRNQQLPDNIISINPSTCVLQGHGDLTLGEDLGQFKLTTYGRISTDLQKNETELDIVLGVDFFFLNNALAIVEENIRNMREPEDLNLNRFKYTSFLHKNLDGPAARQLMDEYVLTGSFRRFPPELNHTFFFADVKMKWNDKSQSFHSSSPIGIGNMERFPINLYLDGFIELRKTRAEDIFTMVLIPSGLAAEGVGVDWYFFTYTNNILQTIGSGTEYNDLIRNVPPRIRRMTVERGERPFTYILAAERRPFDFVRSMKLLND